MKLASFSLAAAALVFASANSLAADHPTYSVSDGYFVSDSSDSSEAISLTAMLGDEQKDVHDQKDGHGQKSYCDDGCAQKEGKGKGCGCSCYLFGPDEAFSITPDNCHNITVGGWTQIGYHDKATPLSTFYGEGSSFNDVPGNVNLHQQWLYLEKALSGDECYWDWGFRADIMYGTDASKTQAFGGSGWDTDWNHGVYGWALPQLYAEVGKGGFSVKLGHFYTLVGYEVVTAPDNFFYSHALTMFNSEPFTHTGALATYEVNDKLTVYGGWTAGWDTGFEITNGGSNWLGGLSYSVTDDLSVTYISTAGNFGDIGDEGYEHSIVIDANLTERLNYVLQQDYQRVESTGIDAVGINQYLIYSLNDCVGVGGRLEWWKSEGNSHYEGTFGVNYRPMANLVFRPEIRYDWQPFADFEQTTFGVDAVLTY